MFHKNWRPKAWAPPAKTIRTQIHHPFIVKGKRKCKNYKENTYRKYGSKPKNNSLVQFHQFLFHCPSLASTNHNLFQVFPYTTFTFFLSQLNASVISRQETQTLLLCFWKSQPTAKGFPNPTDKKATFIKPWIWYFSNTLWPNQSQHIELPTQHKSKSAMLKGSPENYWILWNQ